MLSTTAVGEHPALGPIMARTFTDGMAEHDVFRLIEKVRYLYQCEEEYIEPDGKDK